MALTKNALRAQLVAQRDGLSLSTRTQLSQQICAYLAALPPLQSARRVALYAPIRSEVDVMPLFEHLRQRYVEVCFPRVEQGMGCIAFVPVQDTGLGWAPGYRGILEPSGAAVPLSALDGIVVPGVGFDAYGGRLGYGAGWYDRTLVGYSGWCIGAAFAMQLVDRLPMEAHDRPMNAVVTESGVVGSVGFVSF